LIAILQRLGIGCVVLVVAVADKIDHPPEHWMQLAADTRDAAGMVRDLFAKRELLLIAQRYELLAARAVSRVEIDEGKQSA
jgi:hypothetical protein